MDDEGTCILRANQAGDGNHLAAPQVQQSFVIGAGPPAAQTITFDLSGVTATYGDSPVAISAIPCRPRSRSGASSPSRSRTRCR